MRTAKLSDNMSDLDTRTSDSFEKLRVKFEDKIARISNSVSATTEELETASSNAIIALAKIEELRHQTDTIKPSIASVQDHLSSGTLDTLYVFRHIFDFPNPAISIATDDEATRVACHSLHEPEIATENLREVLIWQYNRMLEVFDFSTDFTFFTMVQDPANIVRHEMKCYAHDFHRREETPASVVVPYRAVLTERETRSDDTESGGVRSRHPQILKDHGLGEDRETLVQRLVSARKRVQHDLTVTIGRDDSAPNAQKANCPAYLLAIVKNKLDRCIFTAAVMAHDAPSDDTNGESTGG